MSNARIRKKRMKKLKNRLVKDVTKSIWEQWDKANVETIWSKVKKEDLLS